MVRRATVLLLFLVTVFGMVLALPAVAQEEAAETIEEATEEAAPAAPLQRPSAAPT